MPPGPSLRVLKQLRKHLGADATDLRLAAGEAVALLLELVRTEGGHDDHDDDGGEVRVLYIQSRKRGWEEAKRGQGEGARWHRCPRGSTKTSWRR